MLPSEANYFAREFQSFQNCQKKFQIHLGTGLEIYIGFRGQTRVRQLLEVNYSCSRDKHIRAGFVFLFGARINCNISTKHNKETKNRYKYNKKYWTTGKLEYRILRWVSKHLPSIKTRQKNKCKIVVKNELKHIWKNCLIISKLGIP